MKENEFRAYLQGRMLPRENIDSTINDVKDFEEYLVRFVEEICDGPILRAIRQLI